MKVLFFSDIHGITENLNVIKELEEKENFDKIVVLGDLYYAGPTYKQNKTINSKQVLDFLMTYNDKLICLRGNCDSDVDLKASDFPINDLCLLHVDNLDIYCTHGNMYNKEKNNKFNRKGVLIYGHEHFPYIENIGLMTYINVGSISLPKNNSKPSYCIYENKTFKIYSIDNELVDQIKL